MPHMPDPSFPRFPLYITGFSLFLHPQNFAKAFDVYFQNEDQKKELVWATSWGVSTRLMGALVMAHSDDQASSPQRFQPVTAHFPAHFSPSYLTDSFHFLDQGLVLPPSVAPTQVVVVPITKGAEKAPEEHASVMEAVDAAVAAMRTRGIRVKVDDRPKLKPGNKFYEWEKKGVPIRMECGPRDVEAGVLTAARRTGGDGAKFQLANDAELAEKVGAELESMQGALYEAAEARLAEKTFRIDSYVEMKEALEGSDSGGAPGFFLVPWHCDADAEKAIKEETKATIRCYPLEGQEEAEGQKCFYSGKPATHMALFARAF